MKQIAGQYAAKNNFLVTFACTRNIVLLFLQFYRNTLCIFHYLDTNKLVTKNLLNSEAINNFLFSLYLQYRKKHALLMHTVQQTRKHSTIRT